MHRGSMCAFYFQAAILIGSQQRGKLANGASRIKSRTTVVIGQVACTFPALLTPLLTFDPVLAHHAIFPVQLALLPPF
jgi:hypothetical protein